MPEILIEGEKVIIKGVNAANIVFESKREEPERKFVEIIKPVEEKKPAPEIKIPHKKRAKKTEGEKQEKVRSDQREWYQKNKERLRQKRLEKKRLKPIVDDEEPVPAHAYRDALGMSLRQWCMIEIENEKSKEDILTDLLNVKGIRLIPRKQVEKDLGEMLEDLGYGG